MNTPHLFDVTTLVDFCHALIDGQYVPARPLGFHGLFLRQRLKLAWLVFTGRCGERQP